MNENEMLDNLKLVQETDEILNQTMPDFDFNNPIMNPILLAAKLHERMIKSDGLGISACQVGINTRVFCMRVEGNHPYALFNPIVVNVSLNLISMKEGCLSFPLLYMNVKRPDSVRIRFQDFEGNTTTQQYIGMSARVALHEMDHMNGVVFTQKASGYEAQRALRKRMILKRKVK